MKFLHWSAKKCNLCWIISSKEGYIHVHTGILASSLARFERECWIQYNVGCVLLHVAGSHSTLTHPWSHGSGGWLSRHDSLQLDLPCGRHLDPREYQSFAHSRVYLFSWSQVDIVLKKNVAQAQKDVQWLEGLSDIPFYTWDIRASLETWKEDHLEGSNYTGNESWFITRGLYLLVIRDPVFATNSWHEGVKLSILSQHSVPYDTSKSSEHFEQQIERSPCESRLLTGP